MSNLSFGPVNITQGDTATFAIEYLNAGSLTVPSGGTMSVVYTNTSNATQTDTVTLSLSNSFFTGSWSSTSAALGLATWTLFTTGSTITQQTGQINVVENL